MAPSITALPRPFIVSVVREREPLSAIATIHNSERDGAHAFNLHLSRLEPQYLTHEHLSTIIAATARPVIVLNYRNNGHIPDEERVAKQLIAIDAGAAGVDVPADVFDPEHADWNGRTPGFLPDGPAQELSTDPGVIERQRALIDDIHARGAQVMMSSHTRVVMSPEQVLTHARAMAERGPDMVKIVSACLNEDQMLDALRAITLLRKELGVPFLYQCHGQHGKLTRVVGPMLGSMLVFCNQRFTAETFSEQPLINSMRKVFQHVDWHVPATAVDTFSRA